MPRLEYFLVCESASVDRDTNRLSLFNIIEEIQPIRQGEIDGHPILQLVAVSCWIKEQGDEDRDFQVVLRIHDPGSGTKDFPMNLRMERPRHRLMLRIQGVPASSDGNLRFEILLNGSHVAEHVITIHGMTDVH